MRRATPTEGSVRAMDGALGPIPAVCLHDHLDGALRPATIVALAQDVDHQLPTTDPVALGQWFVDNANSGRNAKLFDGAPWLVLPPCAMNSVFVAASSCMPLEA